MGLGVPAAFLFTASDNKAKVATLPQPGVTETGDQMPHLLNLISASVLICCHTARIPLALPTEGKGLVLSCLFCSVIFLLLMPVKHAF